MAFLTLYGEYLTLDEIRLALYGGADARLSRSGGGSGSGFANARGGAITGSTPGGSISDGVPGGTVANRTRSGKIGETR